MVERSAELLGLAGVQVLSQRPIEQVRRVDVGLIDPNPSQPREDFNEAKIMELADSIKDHGLQNPIRVTEKHDGRYELVSGERRLRAFKLLRDGGSNDHAEIPAFVKAQEDKKRILALIENLVREDLSVMETAVSLTLLKNEMGAKSGDEVAQEVKKPRSLVYKYLRIGEADKRIQDAIKRHGFSVIECDHLWALLKRIEQEKGAPEREAAITKLLAMPAGANALALLTAEYFPTGSKPAAGKASADTPSEGKESKKKEGFWQVVKAVEERTKKGDVEFTKAEKNAIVNQTEKFLKTIGAKKVDVRF